ncbi:hypothetical protein RND81_07G042700 [Saponaria officinalis]|uniref:Uncharacterized protein n=1 Tax=Saponaria officinalis TaxID=3572 RepID=A0AAW1JN04_SAPOF
MTSASAYNHHVTYVTSISHHMESKPRLLIRESMDFQGMSFISTILGKDEGNHFNPDLPPVFGEVHVNTSTHNKHTSGLLYSRLLVMVEGKELVNLFDEIQNSFFANIPVLFHHFDPYRTRLVGSPKKPPGSLIESRNLLARPKCYLAGSPKLHTTWSTNDIIQVNISTHIWRAVVNEIQGNILIHNTHAPVRWCSHFVGDGVDFDENMDQIELFHKGISTIIWVVQTKLVFDPGGFHSSMNRDDSF